MLGAWRRIARVASSRLIPWPSSTTVMAAVPPAAISTEMDEAPASIAFSISSLTTLSGRSTTSPAAIWSASASGKTRIRGLLTRDGYQTTPLCVEPPGAPRGASRRLRCPGAPR